MLPKSRVFCVMLLGLSAALLVVGVLLPRYVHADSRLPLSLGQTTMVLRDNNGTVGSGESEYKGRHRGDTPDWHDAEQRH